MTTSLSEAAANGDTARVVELLVQGTPVDEGAKSTLGHTPLHLAADSGHTDTVTALLAHGADVGAKNNDGDTPLHLATWNVHPDTVTALLAHGAEVDERAESRTLLRVATERGKFAAASALLAAGASYFD